MWIVCISVPAFQYLAIGEALKDFSVHAPRLATCVATMCSNGSFIFRSEVSVVWGVTPCHCSGLPRSLAKSVYVYALTENVGLSFATFLAVEPVFAAVCRASGQLWCLRTTMCMGFIDIYIWGDSRPSLWVGTRPVTDVYV
jgi:hypothetical protein